MKPQPQATPAPEMLEALRLRARGRPSIGFAEYMDVALYDPVLGYYRRNSPRIGYGPGTDFLTATTSPIFGSLVVAACTRILGPAKASQFNFIEIGAEAGTGVLDATPHPFISARKAGIGDPLGIEGPSIVFSNELFDAQPFRRFRYGSGRWREIGVAIGEMGLAEVEIDPSEPLPPDLPAGAQEGYAIDASLAAADLARSIAERPWTGLFLAFDYGKSWEEIALGTPSGTGRSYRRHVQGNDLLACPGEQDITCHVCWDWLVSALAGAGFRSPQLESQESFFAKHAGDFIEAFTAAEAGRLSKGKLSLLQLLHPAHMGQRFQALWAVRP
jgi:SAM-dependent MidA family methyltransferase